MTGKKLPPAVWSATIRGLIGYRGHTSPEKLAAKFHPKRLDGQRVRAIIDLRDNTLGSDRGDQKLAVLAGMLELPVQTLRLLYYGERAQLESLDFTQVDDGPEVKRFLLEQLADPPKRRRSQQG